MNELNRKPAHAVPNWQAPANTGENQPAIEESQVEGAVWNEHWARCGRGGLVFLALARSAAHRLGDSAARRLVGSSPAQRERPRNRSHVVAARDRTTKPTWTKPSWGADAQAGLMPNANSNFSAGKSFRKKAIPKKKPDLGRGCTTPKFPGLPATGQKHPR